MNEYAYYNGSYSLTNNTFIPISDRSIYFGDGCYDVVLLNNGIPYQLDLHFNRLKANCKRLDIRFSLTERELLSIVHRLSDLSCLPTAVIYIQVSRAGEKRNHEIKPEYQSNLLITISKYHIPQQRSLRAITLPDERHTLCDIKSLNLLYSVLSLHRANEQNCDCALFVREGYVTEESRSNIFIFKNGELITRPLDNCILPGITRSNVIELAKSIGVTVSERLFSESELMSADEIFVSSTTKFIFRISEINGICCGMKADLLFEELYKGLIIDFLNNSI